MKEKILSVIIASIAVFVSLPGVSLAPVVEAKTPAGQRAALIAAPRRFIAALPSSSPSSAPQKIIGPEGRESLGVKATAPRVLVVDDRSGAELFVARADEQVPLASITKLMTARVFRSLGVSWDKTVTLAGVKPDGGIAYFADNDQVTVRDLWRAMLVGSSNTAALELAKASGLSAEDFVVEMNASAAGLGMKSTRFVEPTGLDERNFSTARDVSLLARAEFADPEIVAAANLPYFDLVKKVGKPKRVVSTDRLLDSFLAKAPYKLLGGKTGYINESGYNIVISVTRDKASPVTVVVLGAASSDLRFQEAKSFAYWAFENYRWPAEKLSAALK
jgi:D-alanyl-D-alanine carboxypeptidase